MGVLPRNVEWDNFLASTKDAVINWNKWKWIITTKSTHKLNNFMSKEIDPLSKYKYLGVYEISYHEESELNYYIGIAYRKFFKDY